MSPNNKYDGFFSKKDIPSMDKFKPSPMQIAEALMALAGEFPHFYKDEGQRMIVANGIQYLTNWMLDEKEAGRRPDIHIGVAAFMMMLAQVMEMTYDKYAGGEERHHYPLHEDAEDEDYDI